MTLDELVILFRVNAAQGLADLGKVKTEVTATREAVTKAAAGFKGFASALSLGAIALGAYRLALRQINFGNVATQTGHSIQSVVALSRSFEKAGLSAESAQAALRSYADEVGNYQYRATPSATLTAANALGVAFRDGKGNFREAQDLYLDLAQKELERVGGDKQKALQSMVYLRQLNREMAQWALNTSKEEYRIEKQRAAIDKQREAQLRKVVGLFKGIQHEIENISLRLLENLAPAANQAFENAKPLMNMIAESPNALMTAGKAFINFRMFALGPLVGTLATLAMWYDKIIEKAYEWGKTLTSNTWSDDTKKLFEDIEEQGKEKLSIANIAKEANEAVKGISSNVSTAKSKLTGTKEEREKYIFDHLVQAGFTAEQAAGAIGSMLQENSTLSANVNEKKPLVKGSKGGYGIMQWTGPRRKKFQEVFGKPIEQSTFEEQVEYMMWEMQNTHKGAWNMVKKAGSAQEAALMHSQHVEVPAPKYAHNEKRMKNAGMVLARMTGKPAPVPYGVQTKSRAQNNFNINSVTVNTRATDAQGIKKDLSKDIDRRAKGYAHNSGIAA